MLVTRLVGTVFRWHNLETLRIEASGACNLRSVLVMNRCTWVLELRVVSSVVRCRTDDARSLLSTAPKVVLILFILAWGLGLGTCWDRLLVATFIVASLIRCSGCKDW